MNKGGGYVYSRYPDGLDLVMGKYQCKNQHILWSSTFSSGAGVQDFQAVRGIGVKDKVAILCKTIYKKDDRVLSFAAS